MEAPTPSPPTAEPRGDRRRRVDPYEASVLVGFVIFGAYLLSQCGEGYNNLATIPLWIVWCLLVVALVGWVTLEILARRGRVIMKRTGRALPVKQLGRRQRLGMFGFVACAIGVLIVRHVAPGAGVLPTLDGRAGDVPPGDREPPGPLPADGACVVAHPPSQADAGAQAAPASTSLRCGPLAPYALVTCASDTCVDDVSRPVILNSPPSDPVAASCIRAPFLSATLNAHCVERKQGGDTMFEVAFDGEAIRSGTCDGGSPDGGSASFEWHGEIAIPRGHLLTARIDRYQGMQACAFAVGGHQFSASGRRDFRAIEACGEDIVAQLSVQCGTPGAGWVRVADCRQNSSKGTIKIAARLSPLDCRGSRSSRKPVRRR